MIRKMTFRSKILSTLILLVLLLTSFSFILVQSIGDVKDVSNEINHTNIPEIVWISHLEKELALREHFVQNELDNGLDESFIAHYETLRNSTLSEDIVEKHDEIPSSLADIQRHISLLDHLILNNVRGLLTIGDNVGAETFIDENYIPELEQINESLNNKKNGVFYSLNNHSDSLYSIIESSLLFLLLLTIGAIIISILFAFRISKNLTTPIEKMINKVNRISNGEYGLTINNIEQIELQQLTSSINEMSLRLRQSFSTILKDKISREQILNSLPVGIITTDEKSNEVSLNRAAKQLLQINKETILQLNKNDKNEPFWEIFKSKKIVQNVKVPFSTGNTELALLVSQVDLTDQYAERIGKIFYFVDITETEALEKRIQQSEKLALVGELAAGAAHEIRNPLAVIDGFMSLMNASLSEKEKEKYYVPLLIKELERINTIIEEMLLLTKPSAPSFKMAYIEDVLNDILPLICNGQPKNSISFDVDLQRTALPIDQKQMKQVLHNLIRNGIEALNGDGKIALHSRIIGDHYQLFIEDNGPGIPTELADTIFDPFLTSKENGTGLGLTIVQRIVENHNGKIELIDTEKQGTTFLITLPLNKNMKSA
ncbi:sensor histidine kinase [Evansella cellulosilytica]|uniref:histidine kinase n=1 Tax=Evansella cellulosilytica (strain ATCC 21833 / DSM 2522 / FERM P-1141 / JCM 9156 / N-4) TaxID=649639 RepID=E6TSZ8_EVAC2|nr:ATP-binding protein [Evansella cellulosilytica]ADU31906.1 integral membrane sensor signal transduction histidine kinase [Evansella cellulosilytica DSM 2522]